MKFCDKVFIRENSQVDGHVGVVYRVGDESILVLLDKEVLWPVLLHKLELAEAS